MNRENYSETSSPLLQPEDDQDRIPENLPSAPPKGRYSRPFFLELTIIGILTILLSIYIEFHTFTLSFTRIPPQNATNTTQDESQPEAEAEPTPSPSTAPSKPKTLLSSTEEMLVCLLTLFLSDLLLHLHLKLLKPAFSKAVELSIAVAILCFLLDALLFGSVFIPLRMSHPMCSSIALVLLIWFIHEWVQLALKLSMKPNYIYWNAVYIGMLVGGYYYATKHYVYVDFAHTNLAEMLRRLKIFILRYNLHKWALAMSLALWNVACVGVGVLKRENKRVRSIAVLAVAVLNVVLAGFWYWLWILVLQFSLLQFAFVAGLVVIYLMGSLEKEEVKKLKMFIFAVGVAVIFILFYLEKVICKIKINDYFV
jgi:hypothetical protein